MKNGLTELEIEEGLTLSLKCLQFVQFVMRNAKLIKNEKMAKDLHDEILLSFVPSVSTKEEDLPFKTKLRA